MPLYEYKCEACGHRFEKIVKFSDPPLESCPECGGAVTKLFSSPAIQFKGSGWYITDYAKKSSSNGASGESASGDKAPTTGDGGKKEASSESSSSASTSATTKE